VNDRQPTRRNVYREERRFDQTFLSNDNHGRFVHRDYAAHFFRWGWVGQRFGGDGHRVLDVGCGPEAPLARLMIRAGQYPELYVGVDLNRAEPPIGQAWSRFLFEEDFVANEAHLQIKLREILDGRTFTDGVCFEVIEHMNPDDGFQLLSNFHTYLQPGGRLYLSTPVFDGKAAVNHVHEYAIAELHELVEATGWRVVKRYGTFANIKALEKVYTPAEREVVARLSEYYSNDVISCFLAPLYPDAARNNLWVLERL
jgi:SAM-dependent methyltransferase